MNDNPFGSPDGHDRSDSLSEHDLDASKPTSLFTVEDVLASARLVERTASICLRADLTAELDQIRAELATLLTPGGEVIGGDDETSADQQSNAGRALELVDRDRQVRHQMQGQMWHVRVRGMASDDWSTFKRLWWPKGKDPDMTEFRTKLVAKCAIEPAITEDQFKALRKKLGSAAIIELSDKAYEACTAGGLNVPKLPNSWATLAQQ